MLNSFCGEYKCSSDNKGRMFFPAKLREIFGEKSAVLVRSLDKCINVYTEEKWQVFAEKIESLPSTEQRVVKRFFYGSMQDVSFDGQGRILLPQELREYADIEKQVMVVGCGDHAEIWNEENYEKFNLEEKNEMVEEILKRNGL